MVQQDLTAIGQRAQNIAAEVWDVSSWPEEDLAAVIGVPAPWLIGMIVSVKFLTVGLWHAFKHPVRPRR